MTSEIQRGFLGELIRTKIKDIAIMYCMTYPRPELPFVEQLGGELGESMPTWAYPAYFLNWYFTNQPTAFVGSFSGGKLRVANVDCKTCIAEAGIIGINNSGAESATRYPPVLGGYEGHGSLWDHFLNEDTIWPFYPLSSSLLPNNPFGDHDAPLNTVQQTFIWTETVVFSKRR